jgi:hypothetical protein
MKSLSLESLSLSLVSLALKQQFSIQTQGAYNDHEVVVARVSVSVFSVSCVETTILDTNTRCIQRS